MHKPFEQEIWRVLEGGEIYTPSEIADEACIPRGSILSVISRNADERIAIVEHYMLPDGVILIRRADVKTTSRDISRKMASLNRGKYNRPRQWRKPVPKKSPGAEIQDFMIRFCRKVPGTL
jgi:hypothetical protein